MENPSALGKWRLQLRRMVVSALRLALLGLKVFWQRRWHPAARHPLKVLVITFSGLLNLQVGQPPVPQPFKAQLPLVAVLLI